MRFPNFFQHAYSNGLILKTLIQKNTAAILPKNAFQKLTLNVLKNQMNCIMLILWFQIKQASKKKMFKYRLMISDFYKIPIDNVEKMVPNVFDKKKYVLHY